VEHCRNRIQPRKANPSGEHTEDNANHVIIKNVAEVQTAGEAQTEEDPVAFSAAFERRQWRRNAASSSR
jgi:hypothetical protein